MIVVIHLHDDDGGGDLIDQSRVALETLAARPGYVRGSVGRATDDPAQWVIVTEWINVGSYRRALGSYEVKLHATPLLARARDEPSAFEQLVTAEPGAAAVTGTSDLSPSG